LDPVVPLGLLVLVYNKALDKVVGNDIHDKVAGNALNTHDGMLPDTLLGKVLDKTVDMPLNKENIDCSNNNHYISI
jgi:hypothetical protein